MRSQEPRSTSSCSACKLLKRRCVPNCLFAPYFPSDEPKKFVKVHKVFGASNVSKILNEVVKEQREDAVNTLVFEAEARLKDPVYGCIGEIASLQGKMAQLQHDLAVAKARLAHCAVVKASTSLLPFDDQLDMLPCNPIYDGFFDQQVFDTDQTGIINGLSEPPYLL